MAAVELHVVGLAAAGARLRGQLVGGAHLQGVTAPAGVSPALAGALEELIREERALSTRQHELGVAVADHLDTVVDGVHRVDRFGW